MRLRKLAMRSSIRRRPRAIGFEAMEARTLLSALPAPDSARVVLVHQLITTRREIRANVLEQRHEHRATLRASREAGIQAPPPPTPRSLWSRGSFAYHTVQNGVSLTRSTPVITAGVDYAKRIVAPDTRKVANAYLKAIFHGNGKGINQLSRTDGAKTVKQEFINLGNSTNSRKIGHAFKKFGNGVAKQFHRVF